MWAVDKVEQRSLGKKRLRNRCILRATILTGMGLSVLGCMGSAPIRMPRPATVSGEEVGLATWYGHPYHGRRSASGEIYDMRKMTAAHRTLPFGTLVRVHNLENAKTIDVRINDRGPCVDGKIIDLSRSAARSLGFQKAGQTRVRLEVLSVPPAALPCTYAVQVGAFRVRANAERLRAHMERQYGSAVLASLQGEPVMWRVMVGQTSSVEAAADLARRIRSEEGGTLGTPFVVNLDQR